MAEAEAAREARAKVIAAEGEHKASRSLRLAAEVIMDSPAALQLRYLQTLNGISAENNSTIIFPVPIDIMSSILDIQPPQHQRQQQWGHPTTVQQQQQQPQPPQQQPPKQQVASSEAEHLKQTMKQEGNPEEEEEEK